MSEAESVDFNNEILEKSLYASSPFYQRYNFQLLKIKEQESQKQQSINHNLKQNVYYNIKLGNHITRTYMPFCPMWSALLLSKLKPRMERLSNSNAEAFNKNFKHQVLLRQKAGSIGRLAEKTREYVDQLCTEVELDLTRKRKRRNESAREKIVKKPKYEMRSRSQNQKYNQDSRDNSK